MQQTVTLVRHGETAWSASGRHTGRTDIPLTAVGERRATALHDRLAGQTFDRVFASPLQRAARTCALAGFGDRAVTDPDVIEWDYGDYEGHTTHEILAQRPGWLDLPRRLPTWGGGCGCRGARRSRHRPAARRRRPRDHLLERPCAARADCPLARSARLGRPAFPARHGERQRARLRTRRPSRAGRPAVERGLSRDGGSIGARDARRWLDRRRTG